MAIEIVVPRSGWTMEEGTFAGWLKKEGEKVAIGDRLFALESDKAVEEAESMDAGILRLPPNAPKSGDRVKVGQLLGYLLAEGEALPETVGGTPSPAPTELGMDIGGARPPGALEHKAQSSTAEAASIDAPESALGATRSAFASAPTSASASTSAPADVPVTPRARRAAKELSVDLGAVTGTGRDGRIRERDVRSADAPRTAAPGSALGTTRSTSARSSETSPRSIDLPPPVRTGAGVGETEVATTSLRRTIAARMKRSQSETAPVTLTSRADATNLVALRNQFKTAAKDTDAVVPAFTDIIAKLAAKALQRHPMLAGRWEGEKIILPSGMHIGIAVDTEAGLMVPVVANVQDLSLPELARRSRALITAAQKRQIKAENLSGGVFTITNLGNFGIDAFTPIINFPETAILGLGAIRREVMVLPDGHFGSREVITLSLTFDHRVVDGAPAARFVQTLVQGLENPSAWLLGE
jgi:pyruvate dehydrogenase E2 component (dihydrolipoamide acetyltransferase)